MKIIVAAMSLLVSTSVLAGTYQDRQRAIYQQSDNRAYANYQKSGVVNSRKYLRLLGGFISGHGGARGQIVCKTSGAFYLSRNEAVGVTRLSGSGITISLEYTASDLKRFVHNLDTGSVLTVPVRPEPSSCEFDTRDGLGCQSSLKDADLPNNEYGDYLTVQCISSSYKKITKRLGRVH